MTSHFDPVAGDGVTPPNGPTSRASATLERVVTTGDTARAHGAAFPEVAATPFVLGLAEVACHKAMESEVAPGFITVVIRAIVEHSAPTPVGWKLTAHATEVAASGRRRTFRVVVSDEAGECAVIEHERAIVDATSLAVRVRQRSVGDGAVGTSNTSTRNEEAAR